MKYDDLESAIKDKASACKEIQEATVVRERLEYELDQTMHGIFNGFTR